MSHLAVIFRDLGTKATASPPPAGQTAKTTKGGR
jgi:hypothetical protein